MEEFLINFAERLAGVAAGLVIGISVLAWGGYGIKPWHILRDRRDAQRRLGRR